MIDIITLINSKINDFVWGVPAMVLILGVGLWLSCRSKFVQITKFGTAMRATIGRIFRREDAQAGAVTPFQAVCTALAATVGTGNIAGVAGPSRWAVPVQISGCGSAHCSVCARNLPRSRWQSTSVNAMSTVTGSAVPCITSKTV